MRLAILAVLLGACVSQADPSEPAPDAATLPLCSQLVCQIVTCDPTDARLCTCTQLAIVVGGSEPETLELACTQNARSTGPL